MNCHPERSRRTGFRVPTCRDVRSRNRRISLSQFQLTALTILALFLPVRISPVAAAHSHSANLDAHPVGALVSIIIEFGEQYLGAQLYDAKITVLQVVRGKNAWNIVEQAGPSNPAPKPRFDYILARVRFEFSARTLPAPDSYNLNETQFIASDPNGREFATPILAAYPRPRLNDALKPGDSLEGWLVFLVPQKVSQPLMVFREDVGEVSHRGGGTWFELYARSGSTTSAKH